MYRSEMKNIANMSGDRVPTQLTKCGSWPSDEVCQASLSLAFRATSVPSLMSIRYRTTLETSPLHIAAVIAFHGLVPRKGRKHV